MSQHSNTDTEGKSLADMHQEIITRISNLPNIKIEICGGWIWVDGDTKPAKDQLKAAGLFWAPKKEKWYWRPKGSRRFRGNQPMEKIREKYGSFTIKED